MKIVSLFCGAGGLDRGFESAGFEVVWANDYDKDVWETYTKNFPNTYLDKRSITDIPINEIPESDGIVGGPPCQSWSEAGKLKGINDQRGRLFFNFIEILSAKKPLFFLAENVSGMLSIRHKSAVSQIKELFRSAGYDLAMALLNSANYQVPQERKRVFFIGFRKDLERSFIFPPPIYPHKTIKDTIWDLSESAIPAMPKNYTNGDRCLVPNHEYWVGDFSSIYMSRNRVRNWQEISFTIQASGRHAPLHPQAPKMLLVERDKRIFVKEMSHLYRRLSVRECARIQTFPDEHIFFYTNLSAGYKMVGNAVPPCLAYQLAKAIAQQLQQTARSIPKQLLLPVGI